MSVLLLVGLGWMYVVVMMSVAEATASNGTVLGAIATFLLYGVAPLSLALYLLGTPARRQRRRAMEAEEERQAGDASATPDVAATPVASVSEPDGSRHPPGDAVAPKREEP